MFLDEVKRSDPLVAACPRKAATKSNALLAHYPNGAAVQLSDYNGKVVLLNFWATWCGGCKVEIPWFIEFETMYGDRGFAVVGVSLDDEGWEVVGPFLDERKVNYVVVLGDPELAARYNLTALPMTLLLDREGEIAFSHVGLVDKANVEKQIQELL